MKLSGTGAASLKNARKEVEFPPRTLDGEVRATRSEALRCWNETLRLPLNNPEEGFLEVSVQSGVPLTEAELAELAFQGKQVPPPLGYVRVPRKELAGLERRRAFRLEGVPSGTASSAPVMLNLSFAIDGNYDDNDDEDDDSEAKKVVSNDQEEIFGIEPNDGKTVIKRMVRKTGIRTMEEETGSEPETKENDAVGVIVRSKSPSPLPKEGEIVTRILDEQSDTLSVLSSRRSGRENNALNHREALGHPASRSSHSSSSCSGSINSARTTPRGSSRSSSEARDKANGLDKNSASLLALFPPSTVPPPRGNPSSKEARRRQYDRDPDMSGDDDRNGSTIWSKRGNSNTRRDFLETGPVAAGTGKRSLVDESVPEEEDQASVCLFQKGGGLSQEAKENWASALDSVASLQDGHHASDSGCVTVVSEGTKELDDAGHGKGYALGHEEKCSGNVNLNGSSSSSKRVNRSFSDESSSKSSTNFEFSSAHPVNIDGTSANSWSGVDTSSGGSGTTNPDIPDESRGNDSMEPSALIDASRRERLEVLTATVAAAVAEVAAEPYSCSTLDGSNASATGTTGSNYAASYDGALRSTTVALMSSLWTTPTSGHRELDSDIGSSDVQPPPTPLASSPLPKKKLTGPSGSIRTLEMKRRSTAETNSSGGFIGGLPLAGSRFPPRTYAPGRREPDSDVNYSDFQLPPPLPPPSSSSSSSSSRRPHEKAKLRHLQSQQPRRPKGTPGRSKLEGPGGWHNVAPDLGRLPLAGSRFLPPGHREPKPDKEPAGTVGGRPLEMRRRSTAETTSSGGFAGGLPLASSRSPPRRAPAPGCREPESDEDSPGANVPLRTRRRSTAELTSSTSNGFTGGLPFARSGSPSRRAPAPGCREPESDEDGAGASVPLRTRRRSTAESTTSSTSSGFTGGLPLASSRSPPHVRFPGRREPDSDIDYVDVQQQLSPRPPSSSPRRSKGKLSRRTKRHLRGRPQVTAGLSEEVKVGQSGEPVGRQGIVPIFVENSPAIEAGDSSSRSSVVSSASFKPFLSRSRPRRGSIVEGEQQQRRLLMRPRTRSENSWWEKENSSGSEDTVTSEGEADPGGEDRLGRSEVRVSSRRAVAAAQLGTTRRYSTRKKTSPAVKVAAHPVSSRRRSGSKIKNKMAPLGWRQVVGGGDREGWTAAAVAVEVETGPPGLRSTHFAPGYLGVAWPDPLEIGGKMAKTSSSSAAARERKILTKLEDAASKKLADVENRAQRARWERTERLQRRNAHLKQQARKEIQEAFEEQERRIQRQLEAARRRQAGAEAAASASAAAKSIAGVRAKSPDGINNTNVIGTVAEATTVAGPCLGGEARERHAETVRRRRAILHAEKIDSKVHAVERKGELRTQALLRACARGGAATEDDLRTAAVAFEAAADGGWSVAAHGGTMGKGVVIAGGASRSTMGSWGEQRRAKAEDVRRQRVIDKAFKSLGGAAAFRREEAVGARRERARESNARAEEGHGRARKRLRMQAETVAARLEARARDAKVAEAEFEAMRRQQQQQQRARQSAVTRTTSPAATITKKSRRGRHGRTKTAERHKITSRRQGCEAEQDQRDCEGKNDRKKAVVVVAAVEGDRNRRPPLVGVADGENAEVEENNAIKRGTVYVTAADIAAAAPKGRNEPGQHSDGKAGYGAPSRRQEEILPLRSAAARKGHSPVVQQRRAPGWMKEDRAMRRRLRHLDEVATRLEDAEAGLEAKLKLLTSSEEAVHQERGRRQTHGEKDNGGGSDGGSEGEVLGRRRRSRLSLCGSSAIGFGRENQTAARAPKNGDEISRRKRYDDEHRTVYSSQLPLRTAHERNTNISSRVFGLVSQRVRRLGAPTVSSKNKVKPAAAANEGGGQGSLDGEISVSKSPTKKRHGVIRQRASERSKNARIINGDSHKVTAERGTGERKGRTVKERLTRVRKRAIIVGAASGGCGGSDGRRAARGRTAAKHEVFSLPTGVAEPRSKGRRHYRDVAPEWDSKLDWQSSDRGSLLEFTDEVGGDNSEAAGDKGVSSSIRRGDLEGDNSGEAGRGGEQARHRNSPRDHRLRRHGRRGAEGGSAVDVSARERSPRREKRDDDDDDWPEKAPSGRGNGKYCGSDDDEGDARKGEGHDRHRRSAGGSRIWEKEERAPVREGEVAIRRPESGDGGRHRWQQQQKKQQHKQQRHHRQQQQERQRQQQYSEETHKEALESVSDEASRMCEIKADLTAVLERLREGNVLMSDPMATAVTVAAAAGGVIRETNCDGNDEEGRFSAKDEKGRKTKVATNYPAGRQRLDNETATAALPAPPVAAVATTSVSLEVSALADLEARIASLGGLLNSYSSDCPSTPTRDPEKLPDRMPPNRESPSDSLVLVRRWQQRQQLPRKSVRSPSLSLSMSLSSPSSSINSVVRSPPYLSPPNPKPPVPLTATDSATATAANDESQGFLGGDNYYHRRGGSYISRWGGGDWSGAHRWDGDATGARATDRRDSNKKGDGFIPVSDIATVRAGGTGLGGEYLWKEDEKNDGEVKEAEGYYNYYFDSVLASSNDTASRRGAAAAPVNAGGSGGDDSAVGEEESATGSDLAREIDALLLRTNRGSSSRSPDVSAVNTGGDTKDMHMLAGTGRGDHDWLSNELGLPSRRSTDVVPRGEGTAVAADSSMRWAELEGMADRLGDFGRLGGQGNRGETKSGYSSSRGITSVPSSSPR